MKIRGHQIRIVLLCLISLAGVTSVMAQDSDIEDVEVITTEADKMLYSPGGESELRYGSASSAVILTKDSISEVPATTANPTKKQAPKPAASKEDEEDSILSFNLLYYIIQKYKLQDIVD
jgi:hypothetical protein